MKLHAIIAVILAMFTVDALADKPVAEGNGKSGTFADSVLISALERGDSLVIAKILSVNPVEKKGLSGKFYIYKSEIVQSVIPGDLSEDELHKPVELFAGSSFGETLKPGAKYALFISKGSTDQFSWGFRNDVVRIDALSKKEFKALIKTAGKEYEKTFIRKFRERKIKLKAVVRPNLPNEIFDMCLKFREHPYHCNLFAKALHKSDIGSRWDNSKPYSSVRMYLPPKKVLYREEFLLLLGEPTLKSGLTYKWYCGVDKDKTDHVGIFTVTFDRSEKSCIVQYTKQDRNYWKQVEAGKPAKNFTLSLFDFPVTFIDNDGDISGKRLNNIVKLTDISHVIILSNGTSAPRSMHLMTIQSLLRVNPLIQSFYSVDSKGTRFRSYKSEVNGFFRALLAKKNGDYIGFDVGRDKVRVFNKIGDGWIKR